MFNFKLFYKIRSDVIYFNVQKGLAESFGYNVKFIKGVLNTRV